jgi:hypothetical protein
MILRLRRIGSGPAVPDLRRTDRPPYGEVAAGQAAQPAQSLRNPDSRQPLLRRRHRPRRETAYGQRRRGPLHGHILVAVEAIKRFKARYVSLWTLLKQVAVYIGTMKTRLDRAGAKPAFDSAKIGARFYRGTQAGETWQACCPAEWIGG